jgi:hypothetical protein
MYSFAKRRQVTLARRAQLTLSSSDTSINQTDSMRDSALVGCTPINTPILNTDTNAQFHDLSYKELQNMCMRFNLPANLKVRRALFHLSKQCLCACNLVRREGASSELGSAANCI